MRGVPNYLVVCNTNYLGLKRVVFGTMGSADRNWIVSQPYQLADVSRLGRVPQRCFDLLYASMLGRMPVVITWGVGVAS